MLGPVSRLFQVSNEYAVAIETALGGATQNLVVSTEQDARYDPAVKTAGQRPGDLLPCLRLREMLQKEPGLGIVWAFVGVASRFAASIPSIRA